jgi:hypothetical protein
MRLHCEERAVLGKKREEPKEKPLDGTIAIAIIHKHHGDELIYTFQ